MSVKALFTYDYGKENMNKIRDLGYDIIIKDEKSISYTDELKDIEVLVCYNPFQTLDISNMKELKWIQLSSIGIDQVPPNLVKGRTISVTNNRGGYSIPMGEWIVLKILELFKNSRGFYEKQEKRLWRMDTSILEIYGKNVGFIGTGSIAIEAAKRLQGFGVKVLGLNTNGKDTEYFHKCYKSDDIELMLGESDVVVVAVPQTKETHHLLNEDRFKAMKEGSIIINISRGSIVDEKALINNIENRRIRGAALDVFEEEPLGDESPLWKFKNVLITPHNSWVSEMRNERRFEVIYENMERYIKGEALKNIVNVSRGY